MLPQPDLNHDLRNKIWAALEALKLFLKSSNNLSLLYKAKVALEQSLNLLEEEIPHISNDLDSMLSNSLVDIFPFARARGIKLDLHSNQSIPVQIDKLSFLRIMHNLVVNAIEAANSKVIVQPGYWTNDYGQSVFPSILIQNDGKGIPPDMLSLIFQKGISSKGSKRGQGLHIVRKLLKNRGSLSIFTSDQGTSTILILDYKEENHA